METEIIMDEKGRILIPNEIRNRLKLKPGEKFQIKIDNDQIVLLKTTPTDEFLNEVEEFQKKLKNATNIPIKFEKLL
jgi:AbrB family looped-hinge helix DNA binding protein